MKGLEKYLGHIYEEGIYSGDVINNLLYWNWRDSNYVVLERYACDILKIEIAITIEYRDEFGERNYYVKARSIGKQQDIDLYYEKRIEDFSMAAITEMLMAAKKAATETILKELNKLPSAYEVRLEQKDRDDCEVTTRLFSSEKAARDYFKQQKEKVKNLDYNAEILDSYLDANEELGWERYEVYEEVDSLFIRDNENESYDYLEITISVIF